MRTKGIGPNNLGVSPLKVKGRKGKNQKGGSSAYAANREKSQAETAAFQAATKANNAQASADLRGSINQPTRRSEKNANELSNKAVTLHDAATRASENLQGVYSNQNITDRSKMTQFNSDDAINTAYSPAQNPNKKRSMRPNKI